MVVQEQGQSTHLKHADLKGHPRPAGGFFKDHPQRPPLQKAVRYATLEIIFEACGRLQQDLKFRPGDVVQRQQIALHRRSPYTFANSSSSVATRRSTSASLTMRGGKKRRTVSIVQLTRKPRSRQPFTNWAPGKSSWMPSINPRPRTSWIKE